MVTRTRTVADTSIRQADVLWIHRLMVTARAVDDAEMRLRRQGSYLFQMSCAGHEAVQAAAARLLRAGRDWFYPYYRDRTLCLGLGVEPADLFRQGLAKASDPSSGGRQMPNHWGAKSLHIVSQSSPTGTQFLQAVGCAEAGRLARREPDLSLHVGSFQDEIVYVSGGEGAASEGEFYEAVSAAVLRQLPVLFLIQDNVYAISVPVEDQTPGGSISGVLAGFPGLYVEEVDGTDVLESYEVLQRAVAHCRAGKGPALVHAHVVRLRPHSDSDDDSAYRPAEEKAADLRRDPLPLLESFLVAEGILRPQEVESLHATVRREMDAAIDRVAVEEEPDGPSALESIYNPELVVRAESAPETEGPAQTMVSAISQTLHDEMERDARIVVFGEDIADCSRAEYLSEVKGKGGVFKATQNLQRRFGTARVFNTPLAEAGIVGRAIGMAVRGLRPVVEIQFFDYIWPAMMQIRNELSLLRWRSNGAFSCPVVIRVPIGGYVRGGAIYHSQSGESIFCHCPGLRVVMPANARDASGLLRTAIRCGDPVLFLEHKHLYRQSYARRPYPGAGYAVPLGKAETVRSGRDATVVTYGAEVQKCLEAAERLAGEGNGEVEVIDLRSLAPYDWEGVAASVRRTGRLLVVHEENRSFGVGAEIAARAAEELFEDLDAPVLRVGSEDVHVGYAPKLAEWVLPSTEKILDALRRVVRY